MRESQVARQCMDLLDILMAGGYAFYERVVSAPGIGNEGRPRVGQLDLIGWLTDRQQRVIPFVFECKGENGREDGEQDKNLEWARRAGGIACYVWEIEDVFRAFSEAGVDIPVPYREALRGLESKRITRRARRSGR